MKCTVRAGIVFFLAAVLYGSSYAGVAQGLKYFTAGVFQTFRMLFGLVFCALIVLVHSLFNSTYRTVVKSHFTSGIIPILHLFVGGLMNLGVPHCLTAVAQAWVASSIVQLMQPFIPISTSLFCHCFLEDEKFTCMKFISLVCAVIGVACAAVPSFLHAGTAGTATAAQMGIGYTLTVLAMICFGAAPIYFKRKVPNADPMVSVCFQLFISTIFEAVFGLIKDGPKSFSKQVLEAPPIAWMWPVIIGSLVSGVAVYGMMYLIQAIGAFGSNLVPFGQMVVGVIVGVAVMGDWAPYKPWEMGLCSVGCLILCASLGFGLYQKRPEKLREEEEEEDVREIAEEEDNHEKHIQLSEL